MGLVLLLRGGAGAAAQQGRGAYRCCFLMAPGPGHPLFGALIFCAPWAGPSQKLSAPETLCDSCKNPSRAPHCNLKDFPFAMAGTLRNKYGL